jgi:hypothetical protein
VYDHLLNAAVVTAMLALCLTLLASAVAGRPGVAARVLAFGFVSAFAAAFFVVAPFARTEVNLPDAAAGLLFEFMVLCLFCRLFIQMLDQVQQFDVACSRCALAASLAFQAAIATPLVTSEGFGIFSDGSRIEYLYTGSLAKYLTYAGILLTVLQAGLIAHRVSNAGRPHGLDYLTLAFNFGFSLMSGSKGAFFLWLLGLLALIDYRKAKFRPHVVMGVFLIAIAAFAWMGQVISGFLGLTFEEFLELSLSRFFLSNDARALAFDLRVFTKPDDSLLSESFRSLWTLFGYPPNNPPLGVHLYDHYFGLSDGNGANTSLMALIVFYSAQGTSLLPALVAIIAALLLYASITATRQLLRNPVAQFATTAWGAIALQQFSQDFLAFQVIVPLVVLAVGILFAIDRNTGTVIHSRGTRKERSLRRTVQ